MDRFEAMAKAYALAWRVLDDGRILTVIPLTFGRARLTIGRNWMTYERSW